MIGILLTTLFALFGNAFCGNYTIGKEAYLDFLISPKEPHEEPFRGRIVIGLFTETLPMTTFNFASIANGYRRANPPHQKLHFKGSYIHRYVGLNKTR